MNLSMEEVRSTLSEILKLLSTSEFQTQLEKSRQASANDAVALLQSVSLYTGCPVKRDFLVIYHSKAHNFLSIYIYCMSFYEL